MARHQFLTIDPTISEVQIGLLTSDHRPFVAAYAALLLISLDNFGFVLQNYIF